MKALLLTFTSAFLLHTYGAAQCDVVAGHVTIQGTTSQLCRGDGQPDFLQLLVSGQSGFGAFGVVNQQTQEIVASNTTGFFNMDQFPAGNYLLGHVVVKNPQQLQGITHINQLSGCYALSNPVLITTIATEGGVLSSTSPTQLCGGSVQVTVTNTTGPVKRFALLNEFQNVILDNNSTGTFSFDDLAPGQYRIVHIAAAPWVSLTNLSPPFLPHCISPSNVMIFTKLSCN